MTDQKAPEVVRTSMGLRDALFDEIDAIRRGESNPTRANAVAKLANGIVETVRMEMEAQRLSNAMTGKSSPPVSNGIPTMALGRA